MTAFTGERTGSSESIIVDMVGATVPISVSTLSVIDSLPLPSIKKCYFPPSASCSIRCLFGDKIADANSVVLLKPLCASSVARKERRAGSVRHVTLANTARLPLYRNSLID